MRKWALVAGLLCLCGGAASAAPETPVFRSVGVADGLPSSRTTALAMDRDGYLWISTRDGLARFDGVGYRLYRHVPSDAAGLPGNFVQALFVDAGNRVWAAVEGKGVSVLDASRRSFRHFDRTTHPLMLSNDVWAIAQTSDGALWFGTYGGGLYRMDTAQKLTRFMPGQNAHSLPDENVLSLAVDAAGRLWVGTTNGLARLDGDGFARVDGDALAGRMIISLSTESDGSLWIGSDAGLWHQHADGRREAPAWRDALPDPGVSSVLRDRHGTRWISTQRGLVRERAGALDLLSGTPASGTSMVQGMEDAEGGLWFASAGNGLLRLPPGWRHFAVFGTARGLATAQVRGSAMGRDGRLWLVGAAGTVDRLDPVSGKVEHAFDFSSRWPGRKLWSVAERGDGSLWLGHSQGLSRLDPRSGQFREWRIGQGDDPLLPGPVQLLHEDADGLLWLASYGGGVQARDRAGKIVVSLTPADRRGVDSPEQEQLGRGPDGTPWIAGPRGLRRWDAAMARFQAIAGAPQEHLFGFAFVPPDTLWLHRMAALEAYRWNGSSLTRLRGVTTAKGLPAVESGGLLADRSGAVWLTTARGLLRYDPVADRLRLFGVRDGLPSQEFLMQPPLLLPGGQGLASTTEGLVLFDPASIHADGPMPPLRLESVTLRRDEQVLRLPSDGRSLRLGPDDRDLLVTARLLSFADPAAHHYRFRLRGYDAGWVDAGASGERLFSRLEPGNYRLEVSASTADGMWSPAKGFDLQVQAAWWRRAEALALWLAGAVLLLVSAARAYRQRLRTRHAEHLREQQRRIGEQGSEAKSRFLAMLGHEIRTPMTGVLGMAELLQGGALEPRQRSQVEAIQRAGEHLLRLVNDALDLARIEAGKLELDDAPFDLHALLDEVSLPLSALAGAKNLRFSLQRAPGTPRAVRGDIGRVRQILLNLGGNAIKFTESGEVALRSAATPAGLLLEISDTGPGLSAEQQSRLFQRFEQAEGMRTTQRYGGSGLGLAICNELASAMEGRIDVHSLPGQGTTFRVHLPLPVADVDELSPARAARKPRRLDALRLLVVEDDATVAEVITGLLASLGHEAVHAPQGLAALTELAGGSFDVALLDLDLPGIDGFELARIIRSQGHSLALIALTARADPQAEPQALAAGMHDFLRKPVTSQLLQDKIEQVIARLRGPVTGEHPRLQPEPAA